MFFNNMNVPVEMKIRYLCIVKRIVYEKNVFTVYRTFHVWNSGFCAR